MKKIKIIIYKLFKYIYLTETANKNNSNRTEYRKNQKQSG